MRKLREDVLYTATDIPWNLVGTLHPATDTYPAGYHGIYIQHQKTGKLENVPDRVGKMMLNMIKDMKSL